MNDNNKSSDLDWSFRTVFECKVNVSEHWDKKITIKFDPNFTTVEIENIGISKPEMSDLVSFDIPRKFFGLLGHTFLDQMQTDV